MLGNFLHNGGGEHRDRYQRRDLNIASKRLEYSLTSVFHAAGAFIDPEHIAMLMSQLRPTMQFLDDAARFVPASVFTASRNPEDQEREANIFAQRLAEHVYKVEQDMPQLEDRVAVLPNTERFWRPGWQSRVRTAAYFEFVSHYGVSRKGEKDDRGNPLPYSEHPRRASFDAIIHKVGLIDEEMFCAELLHDVPEDMDKGALIARAKGSPKDISRISKGFIASKDLQVVDPNHGAVDINKLVSIVDKARAREILGREPNRTEAQICLFYTLSEMSDEDFLTYGVRALLMKMGDRIDNDGSIANLDPGKFAAIWLETCYVYLSMTDDLEMRNCQEWFCDLLERVRSNERLQHDIQRREDELIHDLPQKFVSRIQQELVDAGFSPDDVKIVFRPRGIRHMTPEEITRQHGSAYSKGLELNNFLNFIPASDDVEKNAAISEALKDILRRMFPHKASQRYGEEQTNFGKHYMYRTDIPPGSMSKSGIHRRPEDELKDQDWFGYIAYRIFKDREDFCREYHGIPHAALLLDDEDAKVALLSLRNSLKSYSTPLIRALKQIDAVSDTSNVKVGAVRGFFRDAVKMVVSPFVPVKRILTPEMRDLLRKNVNAFYYNIFGATKQQARLVDKNAPLKDGREDFRDAYGPGTMPVISMFVTTDITALACKPVFAGVEMRPNLVKHEHARRGNKSVMCDDFTNFRRPKDLEQSPFGARVHDAVIRYKVDRDVPDERLGRFCLTTLNKGLLARLQKVRAANGLKDLPEHVLRITSVYD